MATDEIRRILKEGGTNPDYLNQCLSTLNNAIKNAKQGGDPAYLAEKIKLVGSGAEVIMHDVTAWAYRKGLFRH